MYAKQKSVIFTNSFRVSVLGGARSGAGRKSKPHGKSYTFQSTPEVDAFLSSYQGNKTEFINRAILTLAGQSPLSRP